VQTRLQRFGYEPSVVEGVVGWLVELGYVDDARFARLYCQEKTAGGWGRTRIEAELFRRGIRKALTAVIVEEGQEQGGTPVCDDGDLAALVRRRFKLESTGDPAGARRRAHSFLARRGHGWERIERVLRLAFADEA
jgi:regulatory protein